MIENVMVKELKVMPDDRGRLMEMLRNDDEIFRNFGQVYLTTANPGVVKGWHYHKIQYDHFVCVSGKMLLVLYDARKDSPTHREINEFSMGPHHPILVQIPPWVYHGFKAVGDEEVLLINVSSEPYHYEKPDEYRLPFDSKEVPYDWSCANG